MQFNWKFAVILAATAGLLLLASYIILPMFLLNPIQPVHAQSASSYWVTVDPITSDSSMYTSVGQNWTVSFKALWSYGDKMGQLIENATATIQVNSTITNQTISTLNLNTTAGVFSFNYTALTADILSFNTTKLVTQEGKEYNFNNFDTEAGALGLQSKPVIVWYDTFHVSLVEAGASTLGVTKAAVNVTYLLLPEEGLTWPAWATYSHQTFLPKIVHGQNVTINGLQAQETTTAGIYIAEVSTWSPTAYIHVAVAQKNWTTTHTGFGFKHDANSPMWGYVIAFAGVTVTAAVSLKLVLLRKSNNDSVPKRSNLPFFGGTLLAVTSAISLYWAAVGIDGTLAGFDWIMLAGLGLVSFAVGLAGAIMAFKRKKQAFAIASVIVPVIVNSVVMKAELDVYQLATPWMVLFGAFAIAIISGVLIANSENQVNQLQE